jgi:glycosyltransferase involved in cell wall biosynthesis
LARVAGVFLRACFDGSILMRVLFLDQFSELGGAQRCLLDLLPEIERRGWSAIAALPGRGPLVGMIRARGIEVREIPCGPYRSGRKGFADSVRFLGDVRAQVRVLRDLDADLVYVNGPRLLAAAAMAFGGRAPVLFHAHSRIPGGLAARLARWSVRRSNATVVACARSAAPEVGRDRLLVIANGTRDMGFRVRPFKDWRVGIIGRIAPEKGQAEFVQAAAIIARECPKTRFVICGAPVLAGTAYLDTVRALATGLNVEFLGWREDVQAVLADLDLLVIASKEEGMPRVLLEAFSAGVPVVAFSVGGIPEVISDGKTGFLVRERCAEALAKRLRQIMQLDPTALPEVAANARRAWERTYTVERYRASIAGFMERLVWDWRAERGREVLPAQR